MASSDTVQAGPKIEIINWNPVSMWRFKSAEEECPICKSKFEEPCLSCSNDHVKGDIECHVTRGRCNHAYHKHCISRWLEKNTLCPICNTPYNTDVSNLNDNNDWIKLQKKKNKSLN